MKASAPFLIIETGEPAPSLRRYGSFAHWIRVAAGLRRDQAVAYRVIDRHALPKRDGFVCAFITGYGAMVTSRHPWRDGSAACLRDRAHAGISRLRICCAQPPL